MARLTALPSANIIHGFKGTIDFYLWRGLACARRWPRNPKSHHSVATRAASILFGAILSAYKLLDPTVYAALVEDAKDQARTPRDIWVSAVFGHLHEAAMTDFLTLLTECRNSLAALEALLDALGSVDTDDLQIDVKTSALPAGASTLLEQQTQTTALQLIDNLQDALASVATDALQVRGSDQLFTFQNTLLDVTTDTISGAQGYIRSHSPPAGTIWAITNITALDNTNPITRVVFEVDRSGFTPYLGDSIAIAAPYNAAYWQGQVWITPAETIYCVYLGALAGDSCRIDLHGYAMTLET